MHSSKSRWQQIEYIQFVLLLLLMAGTMLFLTYRQAFHAWNGVEGYHSDVLAYMKEAMGVDSGYSFPYPIMFWLIRLLSMVLPIEWATALVITGLQCASFVLLRHYFHRYLDGADQGRTEGWKRALVTLAAFGALYYSMIFVYNHPFPGLRFYYMGVFSPNPFHNATYIAARPFSIVCVFMFADLLESYEKGASPGKLAGFSGVLLLATMTKPSFTIVFVGAAGLIMLYRLLRGRLVNLRGTLLLGCAFIPTFVDLLYQFGGVFSGLDSKGQEAGIGFGLFKVWQEYCDNYAVAIALMIFFPIVVLAFQHSKLRTHTMYRLGWQLYGMGLGMFILLYEKGFRTVDANFSWGYMMGAFFLMMTSLLALLEDTRGAHKCSLPLLVQWGAFGAHVLCGAFYFIMIFLGRSYY